MIKVQYIQLLALRGVTKLNEGETIGLAVTRTGGEPTQEEMVKVNEASMFHFLEKYQEQEEINKGLQKEVERLHKENLALEEDSLFLSCLQGAGVDNWDGYGDAQEMLDEIKNGEQ